MQPISMSTIRPNTKTNTSISTTTQQNVLSEPLVNQKQASLRFDTSAITSKFNQMGAAVVSKASMGGRLLSSSNTSAQVDFRTMTDDKSGDGSYPTGGQCPVSARSSVTSGFSLNMFQSKKIAAANTTKEHEQITPELQHSKQGERNEDDVNFRVTHNQHGIEDRHHHITSRGGSNINLMAGQSSYGRHQTGLTSTTSDFGRLHEFSDPLPSPASAVASLTRDLESDLNAHRLLELRDWALQGQYVVKPQVVHQ